MPLCCLNCVLILTDDGLIRGFAFHSSRTNSKLHEAHVDTSQSKRADVKRSRRKIFLAFCRGLDCENIQEKPFKTSENRCWALDPFFCLTSLCMTATLFQRAKGSDERRRQIHVFRESFSFKIIKCFFSLLAEVVENILDMAPIYSSIELHSSKSSKLVVDTFITEPW